MMKDFSKVTTITANSYAKDAVAIAMRATLMEDGTWNIVKNVRNVLMRACSRPSAWKTVKSQSTQITAKDADYVQIPVNLMQSQ